MFTLVSATTIMYLLPLSTGIVVAFGEQNLIGANCLAQAHLSSRYNLCAMGLALYTYR